MPALSWEQRICSRAFEGGRKTPVWILSASHTPSIFRAKGGGSRKPNLSCFPTWSAAQSVWSLVQRHLGAPRLAAAPAVQPQGDTSPAAFSCGYGCGPLSRTAGAQSLLSPPRSGNHGPGVCWPCFLVSRIQSHWLLDSDSCSQFSSPPEPPRGPQTAALTVPRSVPGRGFCRRVREEVRWGRGGCVPISSGSSWPGAPGRSFPGSLPAHASPGLPPGAPSSW